MAVNRTFQAVISVLDRTAAPLRAIQARLRGLAPETLSVGQNLRLMADRLRALSDQSGLTRVAQMARQAGSAVARLGAGLAVVGGTLGALASGAGLAYFANMVRGTVDAAGALQDLSDQLGMSVEDIQEFQHAGAQAGIGAEAMTGALEKLQRGIAEAAAGKNDDLAALFRRLRIPLRNASGELRSASELMPELAEGFRRNENASLRTRMAMAVFGRAGGPMIRMLRGGSEALEEQRRRFRELGGQIRSDNVGVLDEVGDRYAEVGVAITGVRDAIAVRLAPALAPLLEQFATWIAANRDLIATRVTEWVTGIATALARIDLAGLIEQFSEFAAMVNRVVQQLGGWRRVLIVIAVVALAPIILALGKFLLIVGAVALAATLLIEAWDPVRSFFADLWDGIAGRVGRFLSRLRREIEAVRNLLRSLEPGGSGSDPARQQEQRGNLRDRGRAGGVYDGPAIDPDTGAPVIYPGAPRALPQLYAPPASGGGAAAPASQPTEVVVRFEDLPRNARVETRRRGTLRPAVELDVGYARLGATP
jgi:hypothetical protein